MIETLQGLDPLTRYLAWAVIGLGSVLGMVPVVVGLARARRAR